MLTCAYCDASHAAVLRRWEFFIPMQPNSLNARVFNGKRWLGRQYRDERDDWIMAIRFARMSERITIAKSKRRVIVTRFYAGREKLRDYINLVGGCKPVIDALALEGLLIDDSPIHLEDHYRQVRDPEKSGLAFVIEELADAGS